MPNRPFETDPNARDYQPIVTLPPEWLPCDGCGLALPIPEQVGPPRELTSYERVLPPDAPPLVGRPRPRPFFTTMSRCTDCSARSEQAAALVKQYPRAIATSEFSFHGSHAVEQLERVLAGLAIIEQAPTIKNARAMHLLMETMLPATSAILWSSRFAPVALRDAKSKTGTARPWAHLRADDATRMRQAYATWLRRRTEVPRPHPHPDGSGCYICGIGEYVAETTGAAWQPVRLNPGVLGGQWGAPVVEAHVCADCRAVHADIGAWGPTLLDKLVLQAAGVQPLADAHDLQPNGVQAWGTTGRKRPNPTPFEHVNLAQLADDVRSGAFL
ncbi:hypothetical protein [Agrococcus casei]|uniref:hypothetical protein n=1 Tax=Agrococcus casei TaxID=343512 RepID=UPI003F93438E